MVVEVRADPLRAIAYFADYVRWVHRWEPRAHQRPWFAALQELANGRLRHTKRSEGCRDCRGYAGCGPEHSTSKLMILAPPAYGKSTLVIEFACWMIGRSAMRGETPHVGYICYGDDPAMARSVAIRDTIAGNQRYREVFPLVEPDKAKGWGQKEWFCQRAEASNPHPTLRAAGFMGGILSYRFTALGVIDDPHPTLSFLTQGAKEEAWRTWRDTIATRADEKTPWVLICTRAADDDLAGRIMKTELEWEVIRTPALDEDDNSIWPLEEDTGKGHTAEWLLALRESDPRTFQTQYLALPPSTAAAVFKWWTYAPRKPSPDEVEQVIQSWDTASTMQARRSQSYNVMVEGLKLRSGRVYLNRVYRQQKAPAEVSKDMARLFDEAEEEWGKGRTRVIVENKSSGLAFVSFLQEYSAIGKRIQAVDIPGMAGQRGQSDLMTRASAMSHLFESGIFQLPFEWTPWKDDYVQEVSAFDGTGHGHTDQVAATILLLENLFPVVPFYAPYMGPVRIAGWTA